MTQWGPGCGNVTAKDPASGLWSAMTCPVSRVTVNPVYVTFGMPPGTTPKWVAPGSATILIVTGTPATILPVSWTIPTAGSLSGIPGSPGGGTAINGPCM